MSYKRFKFFYISKTKKIRFLSIKSHSSLCVIFLHGFMSDIEGEKPTKFAKFSSKKKINFLTLEYSGHGKSYGKFTNGNISKWTSDAKKLIKNKFEKKNFIMIGSSMGSWIALSTLNNRSSIKALILSGSSKLPRLTIIANLIIIKLDILINGRFNQSKIIDGLTIRRFNSEYKPNRTPNDWISSDIESVDNYTNDPLCGFIVTSSLWLDLCNGLMMIFKKDYYSHLNKDIPVLVMSGEYDAASSNSKLSQQLYKFLLTIFNNVSLKIVKDARHEVFTEVNKLSSYNYIINYIKQF